MLWFLRHIVELPLPENSGIVIKQGFVVRDAEYQKGMGSAFGAPIDSDETERESDFSSEYTVSDQRREHILDGDPPGTGHGPGRENRIGAFPDTWTDGQVIAAIERVANDPNSTWKQATGAGYITAPITQGGPDPNAPILTGNGSPVRFKVQGQDHGLDIEVIIEPNGEGIITGFVKGR